MGVNRRRRKRVIAIMSFILSLLSSILKLILPTLMDKANEETTAKDAPSVPKRIRTAFANKLRRQQGRIRSRK